MKFSSLVLLFTAGLIERSVSDSAPDCSVVGTGYQICKNDSSYYECANGYGLMTRPVAPGTKCCSDLTTERITLTFPGSDCPPPQEPPVTCTASYTKLADDWYAETIPELSGKDDAVTEVNLGFDFNWLGGTNTTSSVHVTSNGNISINPGDETDCYDLYDIGTYDYPRIAVANADTTLKDGDVYIKRSATSIIISWENVYQLGSAGEEYNVQAHLYSNGSVDICFGDRVVDVLDDYFTSGLESGDPGADEVYTGPRVAAPLPGPPFDDVGITKTLPDAGSCYCFTPEMGEFIKN